MEMYKLKDNLHSIGTVNNGIVYNEIYSINYITCWTNSQVN